MKNANLKWENDTPISQSFDEGYFSIHGGLEECRHVFLKGNDLPNAWKDKKLFTIIEAGFGTGLNFLATWDLFENHPSHELYFVSIEKEPLSLDDLKKAHSFFPEISERAKKLHEKYPPLTSGFHLLDFGKVKLLLCFGEIKNVLKNISCKADAWFLDGFSPSKNPDMWNIQTLGLVKKCSHKNTTLATYSVAKVIRENLTSLGYEIEKKEGFGKKRHMLSAFLKEDVIYHGKPWFALPKPTNAKKAMIIGAGIAGSSLAYLLAKRGWEVDVFEKGAHAGYGASGNHCGVVAPLITKPQIDLGRMYKGAFLQALSWYKELGIGGFYGVKHYAHDKTYKKRWDIWSEKKSVLFSCKKDEIDRYFDIKSAGFLQPQKSCVELINSSSNIHFYPNSEVKNFTYNNDLWKLHVKNGESFEAPVLIVAVGYESEKFFPNNSFLTQKIRGQVTLLPKTLDTKQPLCADGYVCPFVDGKQVIGATYIKDDECKEVRSEDNAQNLLSVKEFFTSSELDPKKLDGRVSFRCSSNDRFPIIGAVHDEEFYKKEYKAMPWKKHKPELFKPAEYLPNLYISTAHGSRGLTSAILGANIITSMLEGLPVPLENDLLEALHPARFTVRRLQRQEVW